MWSVLFQCIDSNLMQDVCQKKKIRENLINLNLIILIWAWMHMQMSLKGLYRKGKWCKSYMLQTWTTCVSLFVCKCSQMALFLQYPLGESSAQPGSLQAATNLLLAWALFPRRSSSQCPQPDEDSVGSGGVARIILWNICDQAQKNYIIKGRWTGGARRHEKPQLEKKIDRK